MELHGLNMLGGGPSPLPTEGDGFRALNPATGETLEPVFHDASPREIDEAFTLADAATDHLGTDRERRAGLLERIADALEGLGDALVERATQETGLPAGRINMERGRTCGQLRLFAKVLREGSYLEARIDHAQPDREPIPKPDIRQMHVPLGPVAVFGASNFPLAFSVAGGDTASALAAGCPVVVKAHPAHPGTCEMVGRAIADAIAACDLPAGTFSLMHGAGHGVGTGLVRHPKTCAVAFTGSFAGGNALLQESQKRSPIPFYAEMSSVNPVVVLPGAAAERGDAIAAGLQQAVCLGVGQFCTNPGVVFAVDDDATTAFVEKLGALLGEAPNATMLHAGIHASYVTGQQRLRAIEGVGHVGRDADDAGPGNADATPALFTCDADTFKEHPELRDEVFGPSTLIVRCASVTEIEQVVGSFLDGQLTATVHGTNDELDDAAALVGLLRDVSGRVIVNGFPTGVEVCPSMHHGGPFPATSDSRTTSVGTAAIRRFLRPICYQGFPQTLLPDELKDGNPCEVLRLVDGEWSRE
ncbi:MAG: aldehyde dehydrogenase (NADP(+)) [Planctomycetes bacterium]|nr:aldehyde dehydrogenase (NADP(+)) [Planctomycetota bacterium]